MKKRNNLARALWENFRHRIVKPKKCKGSYSIKNDKKVKHRSV